MYQRTIVTSIVLLLAAGAGAQQQPAGSGTVIREDVRTWTLETEGREYEARPVTPAYAGDSGLFHLPSAHTLPQGRVSVSLFRDNLDRDPKDIDHSIHGLSLAWGATSSLELFASVGLQGRIDVDALSQPGYFNDLPFAGTDPVSPGWQTGFGDVWLGAKYRLLDDYRGDALGLALRARLKLPTADEARGLGTGEVSGRADLVVSRRLGYGADLHASLGYEANADPEGLDIGNAIAWGVGFDAPALRSVQLQAELTGRSYRGGSFPQTAPVDLVVGPVLYLRPGLFVRPAVSWNLAFDDRGLGASSRSYTGRQVSVGYHPGTPARRIHVPPPPPPPPPQNRNPTVACRVARSSVIPGDSVSCSGTGSDPDGDALTWEWSANAGRITGNGAEATYDSSGVTPGTDVHITVRVADGRGGTASATCGVRVELAPEPYTCISGGFPSNRGQRDNSVAARLNNVDKACLDDVASRLRQDPRARLLVVGHADAAETNPEVVSRVRAENVRLYLVEERGVDESRISARGAGASRPLAPGTSRDALSRNRRVEVILLPAGARAPELD